MTRERIAGANEAGFRHIVLRLPAPYREHVADWITCELINTSN